MEAVNKIGVHAVPAFRSKIYDYIQLVKLRLSLLVVFSASMAYLWATEGKIDILTIWLLSIGGFLITGSANVFNQVIERNSDKLMKRTLNRPLPDKRLKVKEAAVLGIILGISGLFILSRINLLSAILGAVAIVLYVCVYTPLKKITPLTIIPGALAGSLPIVIGCVAATGEISFQAWMLFLLQFVWQFPHTWSIAWLLSDEYNKAGIKMLPTTEGRNKASAAIILASTFLIVPAGLLMYMYESTGMHACWLLALAGITLTIFAYKLYNRKTDRSAIGLMLGSFVYLPFVLIILVVEKFLG